MLPKRLAAEIAGRSALLAAALLTALPSPASDLVNIRATVGMPQVAISGGSVAAWRNIGVIAENDLVDVEAKIAACSPAGTRAAIDFPGGAAAMCSSASLSGDSVAGHEFGAKLKIPRLSEDAPFVDFSIRQWRSPLRDGVSGKPASGATAAMTITHVLGPLEAFYGYSMPFASPQERWHSGFAGIAWRTASGLAIELAADRDREVTTGQVDRRFTIRFVLPAATVRGLRLGGYVAYAPDDPAGANRAGLGVDYAF